MLTPQEATVSIAILQPNGKGGGEPAAVSVSLAFR